MKLFGGCTSLPARWDDKCLSRWMDGSAAWADCWWRCGADECQPPPPHTPGGSAASPSASSASRLQAWWRYSAVKEGGIDKDKKEKNSYAKSDAVRGTTLLCPSRKSHSFSSQSEGGGVTMATTGGGGEPVPISCGCGAGLCVCATV